MGPKAHCTHRPSSSVSPEFGLRMTSPATVALLAAGSANGNPPARKNGTDRRQNHGVRETFAGIIGGATLVLVGHPLDTVKVRLQTGGGIRYDGMLDCFRKTVREEGYRGLYKGMLAPLVGMSAVKSVLFGAYARARHWLGPLAASEKQPASWLLSTGLCGMFAGTCSAFVESPMELLKSQRQVQYGAGGAQQSSTSTAALCQAIVQRHGVRGLYQGLGATFLRNIPGFGIFFVSYESVKHCLHPEPGAPSPLSVLVAGMVAGVAYWTLCYPADVIKSNMQADRIDAAERRFQSVFDCIRQLNAAARHPGGGGLLATYYRGLLPCAVRAAGGNAALFAAVETARIAFDKLFATTE